MSAPVDKRTARKLVLQARNMLSAAEIEGKSALIQERLCSWPRFLACEAVMFYWAIGSEVRTEAAVAFALRSGKRVALPKADVAARRLWLSWVSDPSRELVPGAYGIMEPGERSWNEARSWELELVVVPGVVYDITGARIGYGAGFYDRFFKELRGGCVLVGLAYELQVLEGIAAEPHDRRVDFLITEARLIDCRLQGGFR